MKDITGKREADVTDVWRVHSSTLDWGQLFARGFTRETTAYPFPDGSITWFAAFEWNHPLPEEARRAAR